MKQNRQNDPFAPKTSGNRRPAGPQAPQPGRRPAPAQGPQQRRPMGNVPPQARGNIRRAPQGTMEGQQAQRGQRPFPQNTTSRPGQPQQARRPLQSGRPDSIPPQARPAVRQQPPGRPGPPPRDSRRAFGEDERANRMPAQEGRSAKDKRRGKKSKNKAAEKGAKSGVPKWLLITLDILIVAIVALALYFILKPIIDERNAEDLKQKILKQMDEEKKPVTFEISKDFGEVQGERYEDFGVSFVEPEDDGSKQVSLTYSGTLVIPKIGVKTPVADDVEKYSLRFGVGILPQLSALDQDGLTAIFGHRFLTSGRDFNRLDEILPGDQFYIDYLPHGKRYYYNVEDQVIINEKELRNYIFDYYEDNLVVLVTCHPAVYNEQNERLLIFARPDLEKTTSLPGN